MIAGLTAAVCFEVCVCVVHAQILTHTCTGIYTCTHHPGNEAVCLPCITNHTQVWQAMKRLSTFNMQLEIFFFLSFSKAMRPPLSTPTPWRSDYLSDWKPCMKCQTPSPPLCLLKTQTEHEYCRVSMKGESRMSEASIFFSQKHYNYFACCSAKWAAVVIISIINN